MFTCTTSTACNEIPLDSASSTRAAGCDIRREAYAPHRLDLPSGKPARRRDEMIEREHQLAATALQLKSPTTCHMPQAEDLSQGLPSIERKKSEPPLSHCPFCTVSIIDSFIFVIHNHMNPHTRFRAYRSLSNKFAGSNHHENGKSLSSGDIA